LSVGPWLRLSPQLAIILGFDDTCERGCDINISPDVVIQRVRFGWILRPDFFCKDIRTAVFQPVIRSERLTEKNLTGILFAAPCSIAGNDHIKRHSVSHNGAFLGLRHQRWLVRQPATNKSGSCRAVLTQDEVPLTPASRYHEFAYSMPDYRPTGWSKK